MYQGQWPRENKVTQIISVLQYSISIESYNAKTNKQELVALKCETSKTINSIKYEIMKTILNNLHL